MRPYVKTYSYDLAGNRTGFTLVKSGETVQDVAYTYDKLNRLSTVSESGSVQATYTYDGLGRLTREAETNGLTVNYAYDQAGNRTQMAVTGTETYTTNYTYDANNRLLTEAKTESGSTVTTIYTYDANGNTLSKSTPAHGEEKASNVVYAYNSFNQLTGLNIDGTAVAYAYNAQGIRTAKRVNHARTAYLLDGGNVVAEVQNNTVTDNYLRGINLIRRTATSETEYYLFNAHGDVVTTTNPNGTINQSYDYDAFGAEKDPDTLDSNPFRYCGEYLDAETGDYYLRARYYDPSLGRFTQQDNVLSVVREMPNGQRITDPLSLNLYTYCVNNPIFFCDPSGHVIETILDVLGLMWSAVDFANEPSLKNAAYFLWDVGSILVPFVPGSYTAKGVKILGKVDDVADTIKALDRVDDVADTVKVLDKIDDVTDAIKIATKLDDGVDIIKFVSEGNRLVGSYSDLKKYTQGYNGAIQAHHLLEQRFCDVLGIDTGDMISVVLTREQHQVITNLWRSRIPHGTNYKIFKCWADIRDIAKEVYKDYPELFRMLDGYMKSIGA